MPSDALSILIVDDDQAIRRMIGILFRKDFIEVTEAQNGLEGLEAFEKAQPDLVLLDHDMPVMDGVTACSRMRQVPFPVVTPILMMTVHGDPQTVEAAFQAGVTDYIQKPPAWAVLQRRARHLAEKCRAEKQILQLKHIEEAHLHAREQEIENAFLVGSAKIFQNIMTTVELAAGARAPVLITGETGTGKNMVAKAIHHHPDSTRGEFISLNCAAIPESLIEAELFGVEKGAFTGAVSRRKGAFELAHGGTLFLDEIGEMPLALQTKLLAILEDGIVKRLGGEERIPVDVRIIAATNVAPDLAVRQGKLRGDLFYRLNVIGLHLPPLRERLEDIPVLCRHFIRKLAPGRETEVPAGELELLGKYPFPGNVRELRNIIERCLILQPSGPIFPSRLLPAELTTGGGMLLPLPASAPSGLLNEVRTLEEVERDHIQFVYNQLEKNQTRTARALGLALSTLKRKLKEVGVE